MPTINVQISNVKRKKNNISFTATSNNKVIERTLNIADIDSWPDFAAWLVNQEPDFVLVPDKEKSLSITFHAETFETEFGQTTKNVVDDVTVIE